MDSKSQIPDTRVCTFVCMWLFLRCREREKTMRKWTRSGGRNLTFYLAGSSLSRAMLRGRGQMPQEEGAQLTRASRGSNPRARAPPASQEESIPQLWPVRSSLWHYLSSCTCGCADRRENQCDTWRSKGFIFASSSRSCSHLLCQVPHCSGFRINSMGGHRGSNQSWVVGDHRNKWVST